MPFDGETRHGHAQLPVQAPTRASVILLQQSNSHLLLNWTQGEISPQTVPTPEHTSALQNAESRVDYISSFFHVFLKELCGMGIDLTTDSKEIGENLEVLKSWSCHLLPRLDSALLKENEIEVQSQESLQKPNINLVALENFI